MCIRSCSDNVTKSGCKRMIDGYHLVSEHVVGYPGCKIQSEVQRASSNYIERECSKWISPFIHSSSFSLCPPPGVGNGILWVSEQATPKDIKFQATLQDSKNTSRGPSAYSYRHSCIEREHLDRQGARRDGQGEHWLQKDVRERVAAKLQAFADKTRATNAN